MREQNRGEPEQNHQRQIDDDQHDGRQAGKRGRPCA